VNGSHALQMVLSILFFFFPLEFHYEVWNITVSTFFLFIILYNVAITACKIRDILLGHLQRRATHVIIRERPMRRAVDAK
jgi:hypothetical protein